MRFELIDRIIEESADRIVAVKQVSLSEEYLADHFPGYPVLPGVLMLEAMVQAARRLAGDRAAGRRLVLGSVRTLRYGAMVRPGEALRVEVTLGGSNDDGSFDFRGAGTVVRDGHAGSSENAVSGRFTLRPVRGRG